jgi:hypothetical protein
MGLVPIEKLSELIHKRGTFCSKTASNQCQRTGSNYADGLGSTKDL